MNAADQVVAALEREGVRWVIGMPGVHTIELYDALGRSKLVAPVLATHEGAAAFMADAISRTSGAVGVVCLVPGAGVTHALSGIAEALLDGTPLVVLAAAVPRSNPRAYQLHEIDQTAMLAAACKSVLRVERPEDAYASVRRAFALARAGCPGPVAVELPADLFLSRCGQPAPFDPAPAPAPAIPAGTVLEAAEILNSARSPMIYAGWGARGGATELREAARLLQAPVATTISGKGVFPESHPLWLWNGFGRAAPEFAREVADGCDAMLAIGCRFSEVGTGSYGIEPPEALIHVDADGAVLGRNFPAALAVPADAAAFLRDLLPLLRERPSDPALAARIARGRADWEESSRAAREGAVSPGAFFRELQSAFGPETVYTVDSGQSMFQAMEHLRLDAPGRFIGPVDFSCMGYAVPAAIGAKLAAPERPAVAIVGDAALLMTGFELLTAAERGLGAVVCVLRDGELGQIARFQRRVLGRTTASRIADYSLERVAAGVRCEFLRIGEDAEAAPALARAARAATSGTPVVVEVAVDGSWETQFSRGVVAVNFGRLPVWDKARMLARAALRKVGT